jgi:hypothetical protein
VARLDQKRSILLHPRLCPEGLGHLDVLESARGLRSEATVVRQREVLFLQGWALNAERQPVDRIFVGIDDTDPVKGVTGLDRPDVAQAVGSASAAKGGFAAAIPIGSIAPGLHSVWASFTAGDEMFRVPGELRIEVLPALDPVADLAPRAEGWAVSIDGVYVGDDRLAGAVGDGMALAAASPAMLRGWAVDTQAKKPVGDIVAYDANGPRLGVVGFDRPDVIDDLGLPGVQECGFGVPVLAPLDGEESVRLVVLSADRRSFFEAGAIRIRRVAAERTSDLPRLDGLARATVDDVLGDGPPRRVSAGDECLVFRRDELLDVRGWAIDDVRHALPAAVTVLVGDRYEFTAQTRLERPDVAAALRDPALAASGFFARIPLAGIPPGEHRIAVRVVAADRSGFFEDSGSAMLRICE